MLIERIRAVLPLLNSRKMSQNNARFRDLPAHLHVRNDGRVLVMGGNRNAIFSNEPCEDRNAEEWLYATIPAMDLPVRYGVQFYDYRTLPWRYAKRREAYLAHVRQYLPV